MIALDDQALARIAIAAGRVPRQERRRWLRELAERMDPGGGRRASGPAGV
jgi:hypothetical protein